MENLSVMWHLWQVFQQRIWSWTPLMADFDNDGNKDLFITSGIVKKAGGPGLRTVCIRISLRGRTGMVQDEYDDMTIKKIPEGSSHPFFFRNSGDDSF